VVEAFWAALEAMALAVVVEADVVAMERQETPSPFRTSALWVRGRPLPPER